MPPKRTSSSKPRASAAASPRSASKGKAAEAAASPNKAAASPRRGRSATPLAAAPPKRAGSAASAAAASPKAASPRGGRKSVAAAAQLPPPLVAPKGASSASRARAPSSPKAAASSPTSRRAGSSRGAASGEAAKKKGGSADGALLQKMMQTAADHLVEAVLGTPDERSARRNKSRTRSRSALSANNTNNNGGVSAELNEEEADALREHVAKTGVMTMADYLHGAIDGSTACQDPPHEGERVVEPETSAALAHTSRAAAVPRKGRSNSANYSFERVDPPSDAHGTNAVFRMKDGKKVSVPVKPADGSLPLYTHAEAPHWMQHNPFILASYRCHYSVSMCFKSLFSLHNETANVWTHLLGLFFFLGLIVYCFMYIIKAELSHILIFLFFSLGNCLCMGCSATFHLFSAHHCERVYSRMIMMDYFGITALIIASFYPVCYYGFSCEPFWRWTYMAIITALGSVGLIGPFFDFFLSDDFSMYRLGLFIGLATTGVFPLIHVNFLMPSHEATPFVQGIALMLFFYGCGVIVYVLKLPERLRPGRFDVLFHSHQLWHVFVLAASAVHFFTCLHTYMRWESMDMHC